MKGKIEIDLDDTGVRVKINVYHINRLQIFGVFEALADGFKLKPLDRMLLATSFMIGDSKATKETKVEVNPEILELLKMMKEKNNETDAL